MLIDIQYDASENAKAFIETFLLLMGVSAMRHYPLTILRFSWRLTFLVPFMISDKAAYYGITNCFGQIYVVMTSNCIPAELIDEVDFGDVGV